MPFRVWLARPFPTMRQPRSVCWSRCCSSPTQSTSSKTPATWRHSATLETLATSFMFRASCLCGCSNCVVRLHASLHDIDFLVLDKETSLTSYWHHIDIKVGHIHKYGFEWFRNLSDAFGPTKSSTRPGSDWRRTHRQTLEAWAQASTELLWTRHAHEGWKVWKASVMVSRYTLHRERETQNTKCWVVYNMEDKKVHINKI